VSAPSARPDASALRGLRALLFDLDGVLTPTADVHMHAWSRLFTSYLESKGIAEGYSDADYFRYVDGRPRYDGVRALLASRGIVLPEGEPSDDPALETVCGLGNRKNAAFNAVLEAEGVAPYPGSLAFLDAAIAAGVEVAVVTSSRNGVPVLVVDGLLAAERSIAGKPAPDTYLYAAELLGLTAAECAVVEDAHSGVAAGRAGAFGLVVGVDRGVGAETLLEHGADLVVDDLAELLPFLPVSTPEDAA